MAEEGTCRQMADVHVLADTHTSSGFGFQGVYVSARAFTSPELGIKFR